MIGHTDFLVGVGEVYPNPVLTGRFALFRASSIYP